jgi:signal transduction histidine kinase/CheY-like chemotaxis protein
LPESWVYYLARGSSGRISTSHGIPDLGTYDGYAVRKTPVEFTQLRLSEDPSGALWALLPQRGTPRMAGLQRQNGERWDEFPVPRIAPSLISQSRLLAWAADRALLLTRGHVIEVDARSRATRVVLEANSAGIGDFMDIGNAIDGGAWISATRGVARLASPASGNTSPHIVPLPSPVGGAISPFDSRKGLLVTTLPTAGHPGALMRLADGKWQQLAVTTDPIHPIAAGWMGLDDAIWVLRASSRAFMVSTFFEGEPERTFPRTRALSGIYHDVEPDPDGGFWIATSLGLVRYLPASWRRPPEPASAPTHTGPLLDIGNSEIVAVQSRALLRHTADGWRSYPAPPEFSMNVHYSQAAGILPDGRLAIGTLGVAYRTPALLFDPASGRFEPLVHPEGRWVEVLGPRSPKGVWVITRPLTGPARLESYDGTRFEVRAQLDGAWEGPDRPRIITETRNGDLVVVPTPHGIGWLKGSTFQWLLPTTGTNSVQPFNAVELSSGRIWFGGREGITEFDGQRVTPLRSGLQTVRSITQARDGSVWVASNSGVHRYADGNWLTVTELEGLPSAAASDIVEDGSGRIWVSTTAGLTGRHVDTDRDPPETTIRGEKNLREAAPSGDVRIVFEGVDRWQHTLTSRLLYSYRLDDGGWSTWSTETGITLSDLRSGSHTFTVRAIDRNGNVDPTPAVWTFSVLLPWHREPMVIALGVLAGLAMLAAMASFATRHIKLERLVQARTRQLAEELEERRRMEAERARLEEQLVQSQKMDALGRLAGGIAHDFNNLLTVIGSYGELLCEEIDRSDARRGHADEIAKASKRATALTQQLLSFSRHQAVRRQAVDLNAIVGDLMRMLPRLLGERVDLRFNPAQDLWAVLADRGQMEQVLVNLAVNARDAMPDGGVLTVETANVQLDAAHVRDHVEAQTGPHVRLSVIDTGMGMDDQTRARIFEPFFTTKEAGKGSGLGLATVYGIVHQNDGHLVVESEPGRGTRFHAFLPRCLDCVTPQAERKAAEADKGTGSILLVEDEQAVRDLTSRILQRLGYRIVTARNADEALSHIEQYGLVPDLLISDMVMPGLSGRELAERVSRHLPKLPVLLMSGYTTDAAVTQLSDRMAFLQKPFTPAALGQVVRELLSRPD